MKPGHRPGGFFFRIFMKKYLFPLMLLALVSGSRAAQAQDPIVIQQEPVREQPDNRPRFDWRAVPAKEKIRYGLDFQTPQLSFFGGSSVFMIGAGPRVGYRVTPSTTAGAGLGFTYYTGGIRGYRDRLSLLTGRLFLQQHLPFLDRVIPGLYLWGEAEQIQTLGIRLLGVKQPNRMFDTGFYIGGGYGAPAGEPGFTMNVLYMVNYDTNPNTFNLFNSPLVIRFGWWFK